MRRFQLYHSNPPEGHREIGIAAAPDEVQLEGVEFTDGSVSVRWMTEFRFFSNWDNFGIFYKVHGRPEYGTEIRWLDELNQS